MKAFLGSTLTEKQLDLNDLLVYYSIFQLDKKLYKKLGLIIT